MVGFRLGRLGVCLAAVLASSLLFASTAGAVTFASSSDPALFTGEGIGGKWNFNTGLGSSECNASSSATLSEASNTLTINRVHLSRCTSSSRFGTKKLKMKMEGCYTLVQVTDRSDFTFRGEADLICPAGASIYGQDGEKTCAIRIPPQNTRVALKYASGAAGDYELRVSTSSVTYDVVWDTPFCPLRRGRFKTGSQGRSVGE